MIMKLLHRIHLALTYGDEIDRMLSERREAILEEELQKTRHNLNLCEKHRQERQYNRYATHNCDYCKAQNEIAELRSQMPPRPRRILGEGGELI